MLPKAIDHHNQNGFSLLEMITAVAILAIVGLLIGSSINIFYRSYSNAQRIGTELKRNQAIDRVVDNYFANAVPFTWRNDQFESKYVFMGDVNELYLTALRRTYGDNGSALWFLRFYRDGEQLKCDYAPTPILPWEDLSVHKYRTEVISDGVREIYFKYAESRNNQIEWEDIWNEDDHNGIPLAIQITVEWTDGSSERWLRRTAGSSGNSTYGNRREAD